MEENDHDEVCSTCSSSSSDSDDDPYAYQLPPRKAYGGVRLSYVPNDRIRARHHQRSMQNQHEYVSQRHSLRGASLQPQSLPPHRHQASISCQPQYPVAAPPAPPHPTPQQQHPTQQQQYAHPGPASGSSASSKDKDKCIIS